MRRLRWATALLVLGVALVSGCSDSGSGGAASKTAGGASSASVAAGASGGDSGGSAAPGGGGSPPGAGASPATSATSKADAPAGGSSAFCKDVLPPLADQQNNSGPPTAKDVATWDHLDSEAPAGVKPDVDKVDQGLHEIQAGSAMSDITGFGMAMQDILQWVGQNCGLTRQ